MRFGGTGVGLVLTAGALAAALALATVWIVLSDPVGVAGALEAGAVGPLAALIADTILDALRGLLRHL